MDTTHPGIAHAFDPKRDDALDPDNRDVCSHRCQRTGRVAFPSSKPGWVACVPTAPSASLDILVHAQLLLNTWPLIFVGSLDTGEFYYPWQLIKALSRN